jgi:DNA-nicking Smr family endonuclease
MRSRRSLTEADREAWRSYVQHVAKLPAAASVAPSAEVAAGATDPRPAVAARTPATPASTPIEVGIAPGGIDRSTWGRFRAGKLPVARTLDLHGYTLQRAHAELHGFLGRAVAERLRCVEVITGRGSGESGGAIRREFPLWLNSPALRPLVLAASHPHAANPGSVRLLLRRVR